MILVSVGTQLPFDRLVRAVDDWAKDNGVDDIVAQIGPSDYVPHTLKAFSFFDRDAFLRLQMEADLYVSHAGMGSILTAMQFSKPIIIMPRDHSLGEHRNDHQQATARRFSGKPGVHLAEDVGSLVELLSHIGQLSAPAGISPYAPAAFTTRLREYLDGNGRRRTEA